MDQLIRWNLVQRDLAQRGVSLQKRVSRYLVVFGILAVGLWGAGPIQAQEIQPQESPSGTVLPQIPQLEQRQRGAPALKNGSVIRRSRAKATSGGYTIKDAIQSLGESQFPGTVLNVRPDGEAIPAGDVDGDGTRDWLYRYRAVDDRSTDPSVTTAKTFLRYGGGTFSGQYYNAFYYRPLTPVGNFVGGSNADAISLLNGGQGGFEILEGTSSGYQQVATRTQPSLTGNKTAPVDLNGDGYDDLVYTTFDDKTFRVVFGAQNPADITTTTFSSTVSRRARFSYVAADVDEDGTGELVRVAGDNSSDGPNSDLGVKVFSVSSGSLVEEQSFSFSSPSAIASVFRAALTNIDGADLKELILQNTNDDRTYVFTSSGGSYESSFVEYKTGLQTAGDLNGDGRADFTFQDSNGDSVVGFGPSTVSDGLTADLVVNGSAETVSFPRPKLSGLNGHVPFGDLDGDGRDEVVAQVQGTSQFGPRLVGSSSDGTTLETAELLFDNSSYSTSSPTHAIAVSDWDGDGITDFVVTRVGTDYGANGGQGKRIGEVNVYYGDPTTSISPNVTLTHPNNALPQHAVAGDFTDNGTPNVAVTWGSSTSTIEIYEAGQGNTPVHTIDYGDLASGITSSQPDFAYASSIENVGDVNNDGAEDLLVGVPEADPQEGPGNTTAYLYLGGSLSTQPDATVDLSAVLVPGSNIQGLGDINGDNIDDFAVGVGNFNIVVYFGEDGTTNFSTPDKNISAPSGSGVTRYGLPMTAGDYNNDGIPDLAVSSVLHETSSGAGTEALRIYHGGSSGFDTTPDRALFAPGGPLGASTPNLTSSLGELTTIPDLDGDGSDEILFGTAAGFQRTNMLYYAGNGSSTPSVTRVLRAPDQSTGLGADNNNIFNSNQGSAIGDFNDDGTVEAVVPQEGAPLRDAPTYTYQPGTASGGDEPPTATSTKTIGPGDTGTKTTFGTTGTSITFSDQTSGSGDVVVDQYDNAPDGSGTIDARNVSEYRVEITAADGLSVGDGTEVRFDVSKLSGAGDPTQVSIYTRELEGLGGFSKLSTTYDASADELVATVSDFSEFAFGSNTEALPVELARFEATATGGGARLTWQTVSETNNAGFEVQREGDHAEWEQVGYVESKASGGTTTEPQSYRYVTEDLPIGTHRFRLRQVDLSDGSEVHGPISVDVQMQEATTLTPPVPNPVSSTATLSFAVKEGSQATVAVYDMLGRRAATLFDGSPTPGESTRLRLDASELPSGSYIIQLRADGRTETRRLTVVR